MHLSLILLVLNFLLIPCLHIYAATLKIDPDYKSIALDEIINLEIKVELGAGEKLDTAKISIRYDKKKLQFLGITDGGTLTYVEKREHKNGYITYWAHTSCQDISYDFTVFGVTFKAGSESETGIYFDQVKSKLTDYLVHGILGKHLSITFQNAKINIKQPEPTFSITEVGVSNPFSLFDPSGDNYDTAYYPLTIYYNLSKNAHVTIEIYRDNILVYEVKRADGTEGGSTGMNSISWNGVEEKISPYKIAEEGKYTYVIKATDGVTSLTKSGSFLVLYHIGEDGDPGEEEGWLK